MKKIVLSISLVCFLSSLGLHGIAQNSSIWEGFTTGPYKIGFTSEWKIDFTRTWGQSSLIKEAYSNKPFGRPVRLSIWYPAEINSGDTAMLLRDYLFINSNDELSNLAQSIILKKDIGSANKSLRGLFSGNEESYQKLLITRLIAHKNAKPVKDKTFPLIIYSLGQNDYTQENLILLEYLASHGYIVVSVPHLGMNPRKDYLLIDDFLSFDTQVRDLEFALSEMIKLKNVEANQIGALGMSMGSVYTLLLAGRNNNIKALAGLDGTVMGGLESFGYKYSQMPYYDSSNMKAPMIQFFREGHHDISKISSLMFSDRYLVEVKGITHADFTSYPLYTRNTPKSLLDTFALARRSKNFAVDMHIKVCDYVMLFFNAYLKSNSDAENIQEKLIESFNNVNVSTRFLQGITSPNEEEFAKIILEKGTDEAITQLKSIQKKYPGVVWLRQKKLNRMGYEYIWNDNLNAAIDLFKFNIAAFSNSPDVYDSMAEAYAIAGNKELAIKNYEKVLEFDSSNEGAKKSIERLKH